MNRPFSALLTTIVLSALLIPSAALGQISLGTAQSFGVLGGQTVTNTGPTVVTGNVGVSPGSAVTGFNPPGVVVGGSIQAGTPVAAQAQTDLTTAYNAVAAAPCNVNLTGQNLGGLTLTPGVYCFSSDAFLTGIVPLRLDFQGNPNAVFLFKIGTALTTGPGSSVVPINAGGATCPPNVFWQIGSSAVLDTTTSFTGNILALTSITLNTGAQLNGRALARNGSVTLASNTITACGAVAPCPVITVNPATLPAGTVGNAYNATISATGGTGPYTFAPTGGAMPTGLVLNPGTGAISGTPTVNATFNFTITATDTATGCLGTRAYSVTINQVATAATNIPTLDYLGVMIMVVLLGAAAWFVMSRGA